MASASEKRKKKQDQYASSRKQAEQAEQGVSCLKVPPGTKFFKVEDKSIAIDILPYKVGKGNKFAEPGQKYYSRVYFVHQAIGPDKQRVICNAKTHGKKCAVCRYVEKMRKDPDHDEDTANSMAARQRQLFWVRDRKDRDAGPMVWDYSYFLFGKLLDYKIDNAKESSSIPDFFFADGGSSLDVGFEKKKLGGNPYYEAKDIQFEEREKPIPGKLLEKLACLDDMIPVSDYDKTERMLLADESDDEDSDDDDSDDDSDDDDDRKSRKSKKSKGKKSKKDDDDDDDSDDDESESDDEDDEDDDDESESDDEDDEDDEEPKRKKGKSKSKKSKKSRDDDGDDDDDDSDDDTPYDDDDDSDDEDDD